MDKDNCIRILAGVMCIVLVYFSIQEDSIWCGLGAALAFIRALD